MNHGRSAPDFSSDPFTSAYAAARAGPAGEPPLRVLKFGSSVLQSIADLPRIAGEIYRQHRAGRRMIVIVSAFAGETDELLGLARLAGGGQAEGVAELVSLGEEKTAALLRIACGRLGLDAMVCLPEDLGILTTGDLLEASPEQVDAAALRRLASLHDLLILPGFVGIDASGARSLLGRGGSDFSAVFIGGETGADCVRLYKDVDGIFDRDPANCDDEPLRFGTVSWTDCLTLARPLIQPRAVEYAMSKQLKLEVETIGSSAPSRVGPMTLPPAPFRQAPPLRVALAGFGHVGRAVQARLRGEPRFKLVSILVHDARKLRPNTPSHLTDDVDQFMAAEADILIDATSCPDTSRALVIRQLAAGRHVVTANKKLLADGVSDFRIAATNGARLLHNAAVGGGAPVLEAIARARSHGAIGEVQGVLNGTVNFLLDRLAHGISFEAALDEARRAGLAEADPADDLSGIDVATKLRIIAAAAFDHDGPIDMHVEALDAGMVGQLGGNSERWIQLATLVRTEDAIAADIVFTPAHLAPHIPLLRGERNFVAIQGVHGGTWTASGRGAGGVPTAEAIVADLYDLARGRNCDGSAVTAPRPDAAPSPTTGS
jgi:homoserine dehydrogenase